MPAVVIWRPIRHLLFGTWEDGSHGQAYCGLNIPTAVLLEVTPGELDWTHPDICRRCVKAHGEWASRKAGEGGLQ